MTDIEPRGDLLVMAEGRARFLRDRGEIKTPELLDELKSELREAREIIGGLLTEVSDMENKLVSWTKDVLKEIGDPDLKLTIKIGDAPPAVTRARAFLKGDQNDR